MLAISRRTPRDRLMNTSEIVACWMAHHQGMILVAAANALCANVDAASLPCRTHGCRNRTAAPGSSQERDRAGCGRTDNKLDWLKASVPVLGNLWQTALVGSARIETELPATQRVRETDG